MLQLIKQLVLQYLFLILIFILLITVNSLAGDRFEQRWNLLISGFYTYTLINGTAALITIIVAIKSIMNNKFVIAQVIFILSTIPIVFFTTYIVPVLGIIDGNVVGISKSLNCNSSKIYFTGGKEGYEHIFLDQGLKMISLGSITRDPSTSNYSNPQFNDKANQELKDYVNKEVGKI